MYGPKCQISKDVNKILLNMFRDLEVNMLNESIKKKSLQININYKKEPNSNSIVKKLKLKIVRLNSKFKVVEDQ